MTDTMMIRDCIRSQGMKLGHVAHVLGITNNTLRCKLENESEFKVSEAEKLSKMLGMTVEQRDRCFFGPALILLMNRWTWALTARSTCTAPTPATSCW